MFPFRLFQMSFRLHLTDTDKAHHIQTLSRTQPVLPMRSGQAERRTHDLKRHGVTSLFAALDVATGQLLDKCYRRHRSVEFLDFLKRIDTAVPPTWMFIWYRTTMAPTRGRWFAAGYRSSLAILCTSRLLTLHGSIR